MVWGQIASNGDALHEILVFLAAIATPIGLVVVATLQLRNGKRAKEIKHEITRNGGSGPVVRDPASTTMDDLFKQVSYIGTKIDDVNLAVMKRQNQQDERILRNENNIAALLRAQEHHNEAHILLAQGRLEANHEHRHRSGPAHDEASESAADHDTPGEAAEAQ